jgi:hypothetical protein
LKDAANKIKAKVIFSFFCLMSVILFCIVSHALSFLGPRLSLRGYEQR